MVLTGAQVHRKQEGAGTLSVRVDCDREAEDGARPLSTGALWIR